MSQRVAYLSMDPELYDATYGAMHELETVAPMAAKQWDVDVRVNWHDYKSIDWSQYKAVVIRTPWDYQDSPKEFMEALRHIASRTKLLNDLDTVLWNIEKCYLKELEALGVDTVPTVWSVDSGDTPNSVFDVIKAAKATFPESDEFVVKPTVSAGSDRTFRVHVSSCNDDSEISSMVVRLSKHHGTTCGGGGDAHAWESTETSRVLLTEAFPDDGSRGNIMVQPFLTTIVEEGEYSVFLFGGKISHVTKKVAKGGDFRIQFQFGGQQIPVAVGDCPEPVVRAVEQLLTKYPAAKNLLYGRIDLIRDPSNAVKYLLGELEVIEPHLFFMLSPGAGERFAEAFDRMMSTLDEA